MSKQMNRVIVVLRDITLVLAGAILTPWAIYRWSEVGFRIEPKFYAGNKEGNSFLVATLLGIAMLAYGIINMLFLRRKNFQKAKNKKEDSGASHR